MRGLSLVAASGGHSSSRCAGLSLPRPLLLQSTGSRPAGSVTVAHGPSCSTACGIFPDQGSNPYPLHWQADSQPLHHQGSPCLFVCFSRQSTWLGSDHRFYLVFCGFDFGSVFKVFAKLLWVSPARMQFRDEPGSYTASYTEVGGSPSRALSSPGFPTHWFSQWGPCPPSLLARKMGFLLESWSPHCCVQFCTEATPGAKPGVIREK